MVADGANVVTIVRVPVREIADDLRHKFRVGGDFLEVRLGDDSLEFHFSHPSALNRLKADSQGSRTSTMSAKLMTPKLRRRARRRRNRMKTRGWEPIGKITNRHGQTAVVYRPFVDALSGEKMTRSAQRKRVAEILEANGNRPSVGSIRYFLENTLDYLSSNRPSSSLGPHVEA